MDYLDIVEVESVDDAVTWLSDDDPHIGEVIALQLTGGNCLSAKEFREAAQSMDNSCCGANSGVFRIDGNLWYIYCDFGH